ncbi:CLUMA_CG004270, isoform A [Clunio marinus]|uniref:CLUMA_CG004270, isoform A n=1 Tax=Clunio marinus TaxID=568069 RepID=A0A1J1HR97_9DIPT|nr:CLUMA_CG004270, isoform A [Clunio marinus]
MDDAKFTCLINKTGKLFNRFLRSILALFSVMDFKKFLQKNLPSSTPNILDKYATKTSNSSINESNSSEKENSLYLSFANDSFDSENFVWAKPNQIESNKSSLTKTAIKETYKEKIFIRRESILKINEEVSNAIPKSIETNMVSNNVNANVLKMKTTPDFNNNCTPSFNITVRSRDLTRKTLWEKENSPQGVKINIENEGIEFFSPANNEARSPFKGQACINIIVKDPNASPNEGIEFFSPANNEARSIFNGQACINITKENIQPKRVMKNMKSRRSSILKTRTHLYSPIIRNSLECGYLLKKKLKKSPAQFRNLGESSKLKSQIPRPIIKSNHLNVISSSGNYESSASNFPMTSQLKTDFKCKWCLKTFKVSPALLKHEVEKCEKIPFNEKRKKLAEVERKEIRRRRAIFFSTTLPRNRNRRKEVTFEDN